MLVGLQMIYIGKLVLDVGFLKITLTYLFIIKRLRYQYYSIPYSFTVLVLKTRRNCRRHTTVEAKIRQSETIKLPVANEEKQ